MTAFSNRTHSVADVPAERSAIWTVLTDPEELARLTPLVRSISVDGDHWCWRLAGISALGVEVSPAFTEQMTFVQGERIEFRPAAGDGGQSRTGAEGWYQLADNDDGTTRLEIDLTVTVDLPLPRMTQGVVGKAMARVMRRTGEAFATNLYRHLGLDPASASTDMRLST